MNIFDNWLIQAIVGNIVWIVLCRLVKCFFTVQPYTPSNNPADIYPKTLVKKQFYTCCRVSSVATITLIVLLFNNLYKQYESLCILLMITIFFCYILMAGAFDAALNNPKD